MFARPLSDRPTGLLAANVATAMMAALAVVIAFLAQRNWLMGAGALYAIMFWAIGWKYPQVCLMLIFAAAPFQNDLNQKEGGTHFSIAEINLALTIPVFVFRQLSLRRPFQLGPLKIPIAIYLGACVLSMVLNWHGNNNQDATALSAMTQMLLYMVAATLVFSSFADSCDGLFWALRMFVVVGVFLASYGLVTGLHYPLGLHKNGVGASLGFATVICVELLFVSQRAGGKVVLGTALVIIFAGLIYTLSRGAWIATGTGLALLLVLRRRVGLLVQLVLVIVPIVLIVWRILPEQSQTYVLGFEKERYNIKLRYDSIDFARRMFNTSRIYGIGINLRKEYDATNLFWNTLAETGIIGVAALAILQISLVVSIFRAARYVSPNEKLHSLLGLGGALALGHLSHAMVDHYWSRGPIMVAWAGVGMTTAAYIEAMRRRKSGRITLSSS